jgi:hypothetical protein
MEAWKHAEPESGVIPIRLRVIFGARPGEIGVRVLIEDGGKWEPADIVWPEFGGVPWKTGLPEDADHVLRPGHHVALPQRASGSR